MNTFLYILIGFAVGIEVGKMTAGGKFDWKRSLITGIIALVIAVIIVILINYA